MSSPNNDKSNPPIPPYEIGVVMGLATGIGLYALFGLKEGRQFATWLKKTTQVVREELDDHQATIRSQTYQDLIKLVDTLKNPDNRPLNQSQVTVSSKSLLKNLIDHLFAPDFHPVMPLTGKPKSSSHRFFTLVNPSKPPTKTKHR